MASYPTTPAFKTVVKPGRNARLSIGRSGYVRDTDLLEAEFFRVEIIHPVVTLSQLATQRTFFTTNQHETNNIVTTDGGVYNFWFRLDYQVDRIKNSHSFRRTKVVVLASADQPMAAAVVLLDGVYQPARTTKGVFYKRTDLLVGHTWSIDSVSVAGVVVTPLAGGAYTIQVDSGVAAGTYSFDWISNAPSPSSDTQSFDVT